MSRAEQPALLVLEDGRTFRGEAYGAVGETFGEAVFNTGMTGYQETLTDPSYHRQVVVMTAPHIGNTGVNDDDPESSRIWVAGYVVRDPARVPSNHRSQRTLDDELDKYGVVGISGIDTRALTRHLRDRGAMRVGVSSTETDAQALLERVRDSPSMAGADLAVEVTTPEPYVVKAVGEKRFRVAALDYGIKTSTPRYLSEWGCEVHVLPADRDRRRGAGARRPTGCFFSNGPGDPSTADYAVATMSGVLDAGAPGVRHLLRQPDPRPGTGFRHVQDEVRPPRAPTSRCRTARPAGSTSPATTTGSRSTPRSAWSTTRRTGGPRSATSASTTARVEGLQCLDAPAFSVQYHPEAAPGPHDATGLFQRFAELMAGRR